MSATLALPSHLRIVECLDESLGFARVFDSKNKGRLIVLKLCDSQDFSDAVTLSCRKQLRAVTRIRSGIWPPRKILTSKSAGVFIAFDDLHSIPFNKVIQQQPAPTTSTIVNILKDVAYAVDEFHSQGQCIGCVRAELILVDSQFNGVLVDFRVIEMMHLTGTELTPNPKSIEADRRSLASILRVGLHRVLDESMDVDPVSVMGAKRAYEKVVEYIDHPSRPCGTLIESIEKELKGVTASVRKLRWSIVAQFPDTDQTFEEIAAQFRLELPLTRKELAEIAAREELARRAQELAVSNNSQRSASPRDNDPRIAISTISHENKKSRDRGIPTSTILNVFLFSSVVLALAVGYKLNPFGPRPVVSASYGNTPVQVAYVATDLVAKVTQLHEARKNAESLSTPSIAPSSWRRLETAYDAVLKLNTAGSESRFMEAADSVIVEFQNCKNLIEDSAKCQELLNRISSKSDLALAKHLQRLAPQEYMAAQKLLGDGQRLVANENFGSAFGEFGKAHAELESLGKRFRAVAAREERDPEQRLAILAPMLDTQDCPMDILALAADAIKSFPACAISEAERRATRLAPPEKLILFCEATRLAHESDNDAKAQSCFALALRVVSELPDPQADGQAVTAAIELLSTAKDFAGTSIRTQATESIAHWADAKLNDPFDAAIIAGWCMKLGDFKSWRTMTHRSLADANYSDFIEDIISTNFAVATKTDSLTESEITKQFANAPLASAIRALSLVKSSSKYGAATLENARLAAANSDKKSTNIPLSEELVATALAYVNSPNLKTPENPCRLVGLSKAASCARLAQNGELDHAQKAWRELPNTFLLKLDAGVELLNCGRNKKWTPEMEMRWAMDQRGEFDKAIAVIAIAKRPKKTITSDTSNTIDPVMKLEPGTVVQWQGVKANVSSSRPSGVNSPGGIGVGRGSTKSGTPAANEPILRFYVRNIEGNKLSGYVETIPGNQLEYFDGTVEKGFLIGGLSPLIPNSAGRTGRFVASLVGSHGIAYRSGFDSTPPSAIAATDLSLLPRLVDDAKSKAIAEIEARLLVSKLAHRISQDGAELEVLAWDRTPTIHFVASSKSQAESAKTCFNSLTDARVNNNYVSSAQFRVNSLDELKKHGLDESRTVIVFNLVNRNELKKRNADESITSFSYLGPLQRDDGTYRGMVLNLVIDDFYENGKPINPELLKSSTQHLWVYSIGLGLGRDTSLSLLIDSSFTDFKKSGQAGLKPLTPIDRRAIEVFLEEVRHGQKPEQVKRNLFEKKRDLWKFDT